MTIEASVRSPFSAALTAGDLGASAEALLIMMNHDAREAANAAEATEAHALAAAQTEELAAMETSAQQQFVAGLCGSAGSLAAAGAGIAAVPTGSKVLERGATGLEGSGKLGAAFGAHAAAMADLDATRAKVSAAEHERARDQASENAKRAAQDLDSAIGQLRELQKVRAETDLVVLRG